MSQRVIVIIKNVRERNAWEVRGIVVNLQRASREGPSGFRWELLWLGHRAQTLVKEGEN